MLYDVHFAGKNRRRRCISTTLEMSARTNTKDSFLGSMGIGNPSRICTLWTTSDGSDETNAVDCIFPNLLFPILANWSVHSAHSYKEQLA